MVDISIAFAICSLFIYGSTQLVAKVVVRQFDSTSMAAVNFLTSIPIYSFIFACALLLWNDYLNNLEYVFYGLIGAATARGGYYIYLTALEKGSVTMVGSITAAFPAITAPIAVMFLGEDLGPLNAMGICMIIAGMTALSYSHGRSTEGTGFSRAALILSVSVLLIWGFGGVFIKLALDGLPLIAYLGLYVFILPPVAFAYLKHKGATKKVLLPMWSVPVIGAIVVTELWQLGYFAETSAISTGSASIVFPLINAYPIVTIVGARLFLHERLARKEWVILTVVVLGILLSSLA